MAKALFALVVGAVCLLAAGSVLADWVPTDGHKMHFPQLPDEQGWDVNSSVPVMLADDWQCSRSGPVTDVHFWGSWRDVSVPADGVGDVGVISSFMIRFWTDVPDPTGISFSHPGTVLWEGEVSTFAVVPIDPPTLEAWFDPSKDPDLVVPNDHGEYFQYNLDLTQVSQIPFAQQEGTIYWMSVTALVQPEAQMKEWGWKSTIDHFNDDAVWSVDLDVPQWTDIYEPPRVNNFVANIDPFGHFAGGGGTNFYGQGWYFYENTNWWNIWFYDNPFTYEHVKRGQIQCMIMPMDPLQPSNVTVAINWSTDAWSNQATPPTGPPVPPLTPEEEDRFVGRQIIFSGPIGPAGYEIYEAFQLPVPYNPEWVSIDIQGINVMIVNGVISHECYRTSLDLSFVINGPEPTGACCYPNGTCVVMTAPACGQGGGTYAGDGTDCSDLDGDGAADACEPIFPIGACCFPHTCEVMTRFVCDDNHGQYAGDGTNCNDMNGNGYADVCEPFMPSGACCFDNGSCQVMLFELCVPAGGTYAGNGTSCLGDMNGNGVDDACEGTVIMAACCYGDPANPSCVNTTQTVCTAAGGLAGTWYAGQDCNNFQCPTSGEHLKWSQPPDMSPMGMDVHATNNVVLADDFQCTETGPITKVVVYGSWFEDMIPDHSQVSFVLSFHEDIPASGQDFSKPGAPICVRPFLPGQYQFEPIALPGQVEEGWYDPTQQMYLFPGDHNIFKYTFIIHDPCWRQTGTETSPKVYWLDVQMQTSFGGHPLWGWKTTPQHWNDDATWAMGAEPDILTPWAEMRYPPQHPMTPASVDLAFEIWGQAEPTGACCFEDGSCQVLTAIDCSQASGTYGGDNSHCAGTDANQNGVDDFCDGVVTLGACCYGDPLMPICVNTTATICGQQFHGTWHSDKNCDTYQCPVSCCVGRVGDANGLGTYPNEVTISDIQLLVFAKFISALPCEQNLHCLTEADVNQSGGVDPKCSDITISDIQTVVNHLFICGPPNCPLKLCF